MTNRPPAVEAAIKTALTIISRHDERTRELEDRIERGESLDSLLVWHIVPNAVSQNMYHVLLKYITELESAQPVQVWLPISTAPRDGTKFMASDGKTTGITSWYVPNDYEKNFRAGYNDDDVYCDTKWLEGFIGGGFYHSVDVDDEGNQVSNPRCKSPSHWMPLPEAPAK